MLPNFVVPSAECTVLSHSACRLSLGTLASYLMRGGG